MKTIKHIALFIAFSVLAITGCKKDKTPEPELAKPTLSDIEVGLNNNEIGVIGRDFHLNAEVLAGDKIETVQIKIAQRSTETYSKVWSHEIIWTEFKGAKNATVHKHFTIPTDAAEGKYDFLIIVKDQNGTTLEEKHNITIYTPENLPADPQLFSLYAGIVDESNKVLREVYSNFTPERADLRLNKDELLSFKGAISGLKGDGKAVMVLINKKHNHKPETIDAIDYSKAIVVDVAQHIGVPASGSFSTTTDRSTTPITLRKPMLKIGANTDNNTPAGNAINGAKAWETGKYYLGMIYKNTTHNMGLFEYIEVTVNMN